MYRLARCGIAGIGQHVPFHMQRTARLAVIMAAIAIVEPHAEAHPRLTGDLDMDRPLAAVAQDEEHMPAQRLARCGVVAQVEAGFAHVLHPA